jgi:hypothetical protein
VLPDNVEAPFHQSTDLDMSGALGVLSLEACAAILRYLHAARLEGVETSVDAPRLAAWYESHPPDLARQIMSSDAALLSCLTFQNFHKEICAAKN